MTQQIIEKFKYTIKTALNDILKDKIKLILETAIIIFFVIVIYIFQSHVGSLLIYKVEIWKIIIFVLFLSLINRTIWFIKAKRTYNMNRFGLLWNTRIKKNKVISVIGPLCPDCECDISHTLEAISTNPVLICPKCQKSFLVNATTIEKIRTDVKGIIESDLKSNKIIDVEWDFYALKDSSLKLKNKGIFEVTDLNITVSINIDEEKMIVGKYYLGNIVPSESKRLEGELAKNIMDLLLDYNFISIASRDIPEDDKNDYGEEIIVWCRYEFILLKKEFKSNVFVDLTYKLEKKQKSQQHEFSLEFISRNWHDGEEGYYLMDNFEIALQRKN